MFIRNQKKLTPVAGRTYLPQCTINGFDRLYDKLLEVTDTKCPHRIDSEQKPGPSEERIIAFPDRTSAQSKGLVDPVRTRVQNTLRQQSAKRDLHNLKTKVKSAGYFRSFKGAKDYTSIMSCISTPGSTRSNSMKR